MKLGQIIFRIRNDKTYFGNQVGGAIELDLAVTQTLKKDTAFVIPLIDDAGPNGYDTGTTQKIIERFGVVVALAMDSKQSDKLGFVAYDQLHEIRNQLIGALVGWVPIDADSQVSYRGGRLLDINNAYVWWQFEFEYNSRIGQSKNPDGSINPRVAIQESHFDDTEIPVDFNTLYMQLITTPDARVPYIDEFGNPGLLPYDDDFPGVNIPNVSNWIDFTKNPNAGAFVKAFASGFNVDYT